MQVSEVASRVRCVERKEAIDSECMVVIGLV